MANVFISYCNANPDRAVARFLHEYLVRLDHEVFLAEKDLRIGVEWDREIKLQLERADHFVPLVSLAFVNSSYIENAEVPIAAKRVGEGSLRVLPVNLAFDGDLRYEAVKKLVERHQWSKWKGESDTPRSRGRLPMSCLQRTSWSKECGHSSPPTWNHSRSSVEMKT